MDNFQIETAQNVSIQQNAASIGDRILAFLVDLLILVIYSIIAIVLIESISVTSGQQWVYQLVLGLPAFLYHLLWETFWDGQSPGKALLKIRVVRLDGSRAALSNYLVRWLLRVIDITLASGGVAVVTILFRGSGQRLGDIAATTTVIDEKQRVRLQQALFAKIPQDYVPTYSQVTVFDDAEMRKIKNIFTDARRNREHHIIVQLSDKVSGLMDVTPEEKPLHFLATVLKDYTYYTQDS